MADNKEYMTRQENLGTIQISEDVVASIAVNAATEVDKARNTSTIAISILQS